MLNLSAQLLSSNSASALGEALTERPSVQLSFYSYGVILRKTTEDGGITEYPIDPTMLIRTLSQANTFRTGHLSGNTLYISESGFKQLVVGYRKGSMTGIWLEGSDEPLRIPLPPLVMLRQSLSGGAVKHSVYAVKRRPRSLDVHIYQCPLPNVYLGSNWNVCWGNIASGRSSDVQLDADWERFFGTRFGTHSVSRKSKRYPKDIRDHLLELDRQNKKRYATTDLVATEYTLQEMITKIEEG